MGGKADRQALEMSLMEMFKISKEFMEPIITLFIRFELAIPLDKNTLLIPSLLQSKTMEFSMGPCKFPRDTDSAYSNFELRTYSDSTFIESGSESLRSNFEYDSTQRRGTMCMSTVAQNRTTDKQIILLDTGMCYRRIFSADHIPANFWPRLIARLLSSVESFQKIICNNCFTGIHCENFIDGNASIGALKCEWYYGKNYIILTLGSHDILRVNGLYGFHDSRGEKIPISNTVQKVKSMQIYHGDEGFMSININDGFEVTIPDYVVHSGPRSDSMKKHKSEHMAAQILSHVLETIDEVLKDWFDGLLEQGIYSAKYLTHFIPCPYCFGDTKPDYVDDSDKLDSDSCDVSMLIPSTNGGKPVGFSVQYCLFQAQKSNYIMCPNHEDIGKLPMKCLAPDLVSSTVFKI